MDQRLINWKQLCILYKDVTVFTVSDSSRSMKVTKHNNFYSDLICTVLFLSLVLNHFNKGLWKEQSAKTSQIGLSQLLDLL